MASAVTDYKVSTITTNGFVGVPLNVEQVFHHVAIVPADDAVSPGFIFVEYKVDGTILRRGVNPRAKVRRRRKREPQGDVIVSDQGVSRTDGNGVSRFINQITAVYRMGPSQTPNIKIFKNGMLHLTGVKDVADGSLIVDRVVDEIRRIPTATTDATSLNNRDYVVRMINVNFEVPFNVSRNRIFSILQNETTLHVVYEADTYQGLKIHYYFNMAKDAQNGCCDCNAAVDPTLKCEGKGKGLIKWDCKRVTLAIFETGRMLISGANSMYQVKHLHAFIKEFMGANAHRFKYLAAPAPPKVAAPPKVLVAAL